MNNGPIRIEGDFEIFDPLGSLSGLAGRTVISLCRCGQSANKPFCDGIPQSPGLFGPCDRPRTPAAQTETRAR